MKYIDWDFLKVVKLGRGRERGKGGREKREEGNIKSEKLEVQSSEGREKREILFVCFCFGILNL